MNEIDEISESNNEILPAISLVVLEEDAIPILPEDFSIVGSDSLEVHAMSYKKSSSPLRYIFEIDTTTTFSSPLYTQNQIETQNQHIRWRPNIKWLDSTVYYWRVATDPSTTQKPIHWNQMSFLYLKDYLKGGWNQSHFYQKTIGNFDNILLDSASRQYKFNNKDRNYELIFNGQMSTNGCRWYENDIRMFEYVERDIMNSGIFATIIRANDGSVWTSKDTLIGSTSWGTDGSIRLKEGNVRYGHIFSDTGITPSSHLYPSTPWHQVFLNLMQKVQNGDYVMVSSLKVPKFTNWHPDLINFFRNIGFLAIDSLKAGTLNAPFGLVFRKNDPTFPIQYIVGSNFTNYNSLKFKLSGNWYYGEIISPKIGKNRQYMQLQYRLKALENPSKDNFNIDLIGYNTSNIAEILKTYTAISLDTSIASILPSNYPYLQLRLRTKDTQNFTPIQLENWRILFKEDVPELLANKDRHFKLTDTLKWGQKQQIEFDIDNISEQKIDSTEVKIILKNNQSQKEFYFKIPPILANSSYRFGAEFSIDQYFVGKNDVWIEINPETRSTHQIEKYSFNNFIENKFEVIPDKENPLLQVTFDGNRIINNELISPTPTVAIKLKDDNEYLLLSDTNIISLWLTYPDGTTKPIYFNSLNVQFVPANSGKNNLAEIVWTPELTDGLYTLTVKDSDKSGNSSNLSPKFSYKISFRVITKMMASNFLNYPNPFSTSTQFVFTLTGSKIPDKIQIQILSIKGQVVKTIQKEELGPLRIGLNRTNYTWDGTDNYGSKLANGVYLYKVDVSENGKTVEMLDQNSFNSISGSNIDLNKYFTKGYGKLVILR